MRAPFAYYGGKSRLSGRIVDMLPPHRVYLEPFFGSGAVLFAKTPATIEVVNDVNGAIVAFFRCLRDQTDELVALCELTPYARDEFLGADLSEPGLTDLELARRFWVRVNQSFAKTASHRQGWSITTGAHQSVSNGTLSRLGRLRDCAERLLHVGIENSDAAELIARIATEDTLIYVDPPYLGTTRTSHNGADYAHDMVDEESHRCLLEVLIATPAAVILSGYRSELYDDLLGEWHRTEIEVNPVVSNQRREGTLAKRTEVLWTNFEPSLGRLPFGAMA